jgi:hypothetical protein
MDFGVDRLLIGELFWSLPFGVYRKGDPLKIKKYNFIIIMSSMILKSLNFISYYKFSKIT